jgi:hypothetical protein
MLHINQVFYSHVKSSEGDKLSSSSIHFTSLIICTLNRAFWTSSLNWNLSLLIIWSDLLQLRTFHGCFTPSTTRKLTSVSPINPWSDTRENIAFLLLRHCWNAWRHCWRGHVTFSHSCVIQVFTVSPSNERGEAMQCEARLLKVRQNSARHEKNTASSTVA